MKHVASMPQITATAGLDGLAKGPARHPLLTLRAQEGFRVKTFAAGDRVCGFGRSGALAGVVFSGTLKMSRPLEDGREAIFALFEPGAFFGRPYAIGSDADSGLYAATEAQVGYLAIADLESRLESNIELNRLVLIATMAQCDSTRERSLLLSCLGARERMASYLALRLLRAESEARASRLPAPATLVIPLGRRDLAAYLATTVETVSRTLQDLSRTRAIALSARGGQVTVLDRSALIASSGCMEEDLAACLPASLPREVIETVAREAVGSTTRSDVFSRPRNAGFEPAAVLHSLSSRKTISHT